MYSFPMCCSHILAKQAHPEQSCSSRVQRADSARLGYKYLCGCASETLHVCLTAVVISGLKFRQNNRWRGSMNDRHKIYTSEGIYNIKEHKKGLFR